MKQQEIKKQLVNFLYKKFFEQSRYLEKSTQDS